METFLVSSLHASCQIEFVKWKISGAQPPSVKSAFSGFSSMRIDHEKLTEEIAALLIKEFDKVVVEAAAQR